VNALTILRGDHRAVEELFERFEAARTSDRRLRVFAQIKQSLDAHAAVEEEIFYPALRAAAKRDGMSVEKALGEHEVAKTLLRQLSTRRTADEAFQARVEVLRESVLHHVKEEESKLFAMARRHLDARALNELGAEMTEHRDSIEGGGVTGVMTTVAEGTQAMVERNQKMMDTATNAVRRAMRPSASRSRRRR
jgi:iron-sulfur cluster repair protein YtfE (RIC family)